MIHKSLICVFILLFNLNLYTQVQIMRKVTLMGTKFEITLVTEDSISAKKNINIAIKEISRIENLLSEWISTSKVSEINDNAGIKPIKVNSEIFDLTKKAIFFSQISNGAFDISIAAMDKIWKFDGTMNNIPDIEEIKKSIQNVGYKNIILDSINSTIFLKNKGMKIGFGSIGKAYSADKTRELMKSLGIKSGIINASGDISTWGVQVNGKPWAIGVNNPFKPNKTPQILYFEENSVATSGNYEKFFEINGKKYSHIINPVTGFPSFELTSVSIIGPSATIANGLSTSIMVLGENEGKKLMKKFPQYKSIIITDKGKIR